MTRKEISYLILTTANLYGISQNDFDKAVKRLSKNWWLNAFKFVHTGNGTAEPKAEQIIKLVLFGTINDCEAFATARF